MLARALATAALLSCAAPASVFAAAPATPAAPARLEPVDLELVIATDTSTSIDRSEAVLQRQGVANAFRSPEIVRAIRSGTLGKIAVAYLDWSGEFNNRIVQNWTVIRDKASADAFAAAILRAGLTYGEGTSVGGAIAMASEMIERNAYRGVRRTIDISGDGPNNFGRPVALVSDEIAAKGITINGLPIVTDDLGNGDWGEYYGDITAYYRNCVIGGRGAFIMPSKGFQDFATAIRRKLVLEISGVTPPAQYASADPLIRIAAQAPAARVPAPQPQAANRLARCTSWRQF